MNTKSIVVLTASLAALLGCASTSSGFDPEAKRTAARVVAKGISGEKQQSANEAQKAWSGAMYGAVGAIMAELLDRKTTVKMHLYVVQTKDSRQVGVSTEYPGWDVGTCVTLLESSREGYPRLTSGGACE